MSIFLNYFDWQFAGYLPEKIIAWIWIFTTIIFILFFWRNKSVKIYSVTIVTLLILSIIPMAIPFFGIVNYLTKQGDYQEIKLNENFRIERTQHHPLSMPRVYIYKKYLGILEKNICRTDYREIIENVMNLKNNDSIFSIDLKETPIQSARLISDNYKKIEIEYKIKDKKKIIQHELNLKDGY